MYAVWSTSASVASGTSASGSPPSTFLARRSSSTKRRMRSLPGSTVPCSGRVSGSSNGVRTSVDVQIQKHVFWNSGTRK